jgi:GT2 family glycosyltransferase
VTRFAIVIATCGNAHPWSDLAWSRAHPSAEKQRDGQGDRPQIVVEHYPELTVSAARNAAAANAAAEWLIFLDADDELDENFLCEIDCALERNPSGIWEDDDYYEELWVTPPLLIPAVQYVRQTARGLRFDPYVGIPQQGRWPELNECVIGTAVHRDLFERVGGFRGCTDDGTELSSLEDYDLWLRCFDAGAHLVYAPDAVYRAYVSSSGRNVDQSPYAAIWADHLARIADAAA